MRIPVVVIGAGHAGLAASHELALRSIEHVVLERGEIANSWKTERWDSLRLLTPNWLFRLPGLSYQGDDGDGFATMPDVVRSIERYARAVDAPVETRTTVTSVRHEDDEYLVSASDGRSWQCQAVVLASGGFNLATVPALSMDLPPDMQSITPLSYRTPDELGPGGVLVVGASASGVQIADELLRSGRPVTVAVGQHVRMPRRYRGRDVFWWMENSGRLDERHDEVDDIVRARNTPSPQLAGVSDGRDVDLNTLTNTGARLVGRLAAIREGSALFSGSLPNTCHHADLKLGRLLDTFDEWAASAGLDTELESPSRPDPTDWDPSPALMLDLRADFDTVIWATGYRPDYSWLDIDVLDRKGELRHDGGVVRESPGLFRLGLNFLRQRRSSFIHGAARDAPEIVDEVARHLAQVSLSGSHV